MKGKAIPYSKAELLFIQANYTLDKDELHKRFVAKFNRSDVTSQNLRALGKRNGWRTGRTGCFTKGHVPFNTGTKGLMKPNRTSFKKGNKPHNWTPIGHERITKDGYLQRKVTDTGSTKDDYVEVHRLVWEETHGSIPDSHIVLFKDGKKANITLDNLILVSRADHAVMNKIGLGSAPAELKTAAVLTAKLIRKTTSALSQCERNG